MRLPHIRIPAIVVCALTALWFAAFLNFPAMHWLVNRGVPVSVTVLFSAVLFCLFFIVLLLLALPYVYKVIVIPLIVVCGMAAYAELYLGVFFTRDMADNVLQTTLTEALGLVNTTSVLWALFASFLPATLLAVTQLTYAPPKKEVLRRFLLGAAALALALTLVFTEFQSLSSTLRGNRNIRRLVLPTSLFQMINSKVQAKLKKALPYETLGLDTTLLRNGSARRITVLIVGETTRAANWGLSGYPRQTTPRLALRGDSIINFKTVKSCGTQTSVSLPCMFSDLPRSQYSSERFDARDNLIDVLHRTGLDITWIDNDSGCKGVCKSVGMTDVTVRGPGEFCDSGECLDNLMLRHLDQTLSEKQNTKDVLLVLHAMGSHGPKYYRRYTDKERLFTPDCRTGDFSRCTPESIENAYNNTIVYADQFIDQVIARLQREKNTEVSLVFLSDHGESLGENGVYLHGAPYLVAPKTQTHVPMIFWMNEAFIHSETLDIACLKKAAGTEDYSHDNFYSTVLGLVGAHSKTLYRPGDDILEACRRQPHSKAH